MTTAELIERLRAERERELAERLRAAMAKHTR